MSIAQNRLDPQIFTFMVANDSYMHLLHFLQTIICLPRTYFSWKILCLWLKEHAVGSPNTAKLHFWVMTGDELHSNTKIIFVDPAHDCYFLGTFQSRRWHSKWLEGVASLSVLIGSHYPPLSQRMLIDSSKKEGHW